MGPTSKPAKTKDRKALQKGLPKLAATYIKNVTKIKPSKKTATPKSSDKKANAKAKVRPATANSQKKHGGDKGAKTWRKSWAHDIGIDLGTANTLVYVRGRGIVIDEPSVVAINRKTKNVIAIGKNAKAMIGKTPKGIMAARPLIDGVVSDFEVTEQMLKHFIKEVHNLFPVFWPRPRVVIGLPSGVTEVERRAVEEAARNAGARTTYLVEEPMAAAVGCGLSVKDAAGSMIVDIGGGTTEVAVIALGGVVVSRSLRVAGDELSEAIMQHMRDEFNLSIGESSAERIKLEIGSVYYEETSKTLTVRGRNILSGLPQEMVLSPEHIRAPMMKQVRPIVDAVRTTLEEAPPELVADIMAHGILLTGGGALLKGLDKLIAQETRMPVKAAPNALTAVAEGTGEILENLDSLKEILISAWE